MKTLARYSATTDGNEQTVFRPQLTSLIDVMTFLLVFLIKSFSVEGSIITPSSNLELPVSTSVKKPRPLASIEITRDAVVSEGRVLAGVTDSQPGADPLLLTGVYNWMKSRPRNGDSAAAGQQVMIQADRDVDFAVLKRVMYSCSKAGCSDFSVLAVRKD